MRLSHVMSGFVGLDVHSEKTFTTLPDQNVGLPLREE